MDCKSFRRNHSAFIDEQLSGTAAAAMYEHVRECPTCSTYNARLRRSLLLARNLPQIEVSAEFSERLLDRIRAERASRSGAPEKKRRSRVRAVAVGSGLVALAALSARSLWKLQSDPDDPPRLPGVVAFPPTTLDSTTAPAIVASMSAGMPVWPALWLAERAQFRYTSSANHAATDSPTQP